jgi:riboflavin synthase
MFTGIVEELGEIVRLEMYGDGAVVSVRGPLVTGDARPGDSIAVNGVCLTVVDIDGQGDVFRADVMKETLGRTTLGGLGPGDPVNLERAATPATRLGGHMVQGHVDGVERGGGEAGRAQRADDRARNERGGGEAGRAQRADDRARNERGAGKAVQVEFAAPPELIRYIVEKGSICVDGVSLTVVTVDAESFTVSLIPTTLAATTLGRCAVGSLVNLEVDVIAKYVEKLVRA